MSRQKKFLCTLLAVLQAAQPIAASAAGYYFRVPLKELAPKTGTPLAETNVNPLNSSATTVRAGEAVLRLAPSDIDFGTIATTDKSKVQTVTLYNLGGKSLTLGALSTTTQFSVTDGCDGVVLPPLASCRVNVVFYPTEVNLAVEGKLTVPFSSEGSTATATAKLTGIAAEPPVGSVKASSIGGGSDVQADGSVAFGSAIINQQSLTKSFVISSAGDSPLAFQGLDFIGNDGSFSASSDCLDFLMPGTQCTVQVAFAPHTVGMKHATLVVQTDAYTGNNLPVALSGEAVEVYPVYRDDANGALDFGALVQGSATAVKTITVTNSGTGPLSLGLPTLQGSSTAGLTVSTSTCDKPVAPGGNCTVSLAYSAAAVSTLNAALVLSHNGRLSPTSPVSIPVTGSVAAQTRVLSYAAAVDFGTVDAGAPATQALTVTNTGNSPVTGITVTAPAPFSVSASTCAGQTLQPKGTCTVTFSLTYSTNGAISRSATVSATSLTTPAPAVSLQGTVQTRAIGALSPASVAFGLQTSSAWSTDERTVTVTNTGSVAVKPTVAGRAADNTLSATPWIRVSSDTCSSGVAPGATCVIGLQVKPAASGAATGTVTVNPDVNLTTGGRALTVTATGTAQSYSISASSLDFGTVGSLQYAERVITVTNTSPAGTAVTGFSGVTLANPTVPAGSGTLSVPASTCSSTLASQASCAITVRYTAPSYPSTAVISPANGAVSFYWSGARSATSSLPATVSLVGSNITAAMSSTDFGDVPAGVAVASAARRVITMQNTGAYPVTLSSTLLDSTNALALAEDTGAAGRCVAGATLAANAACTISLYSTIPATSSGGSKATTATPRVVGLNGTLNGVGSAATLAGNVLPPTASTSVANIDFGNVGEKTITTKSFTFRTSHGGSAVLTSLPATGTGYSSQLSGCSSGTIAAGTVCTVNVTFSPGAYTADQMPGSVTLYFNVDGAQKAVAVVKFTAQVEKASYAVDYNDLNWGNVPTQTAGFTRYAVVRNTSTNAIIPLTSKSVASPFSFNATTATYAFNGVQVPNCTTMTQLSPGQSCHFNVSLSGATGAAAAGTGPFTGNATYSTAAASNLLVPMTANFLVATPQMAGSLTFANPTPSTTSHNPDMQVSVTNSGGGRAYWTIPAGGTKAFNTSGNFSLVSANGGANQSLASSVVANSTRCEEMSYLEPGATCSLTVRFTPTGAAGTKTGSLSLGALTPASQSYSVALVGTAQAGVVYMNQSSLDFGKQLVSSSTTQTILIGNGGDGPMSIRNIARVRSDNAAAAYPTELTAAHDCPATLNPGEACHINVTFAPDRNLDFGAVSYKEVVTYQHYTNGAWTTVQIPLSGVGYGSILTADQQVHNLGAVDHGVVAQSYTRTVTLTASGPAPVRVMSFAPATLSFLETIAGGTCVSNATLQPGQSCTLQLRNRADFSAYTETAYGNQIQSVFTINGTFYKQDGTTVQSDRSVQLLTNATVVPQVTLAEVTPRTVSSKRATPVSVFGTNLRAGAKVFIDEVETPNQFINATELRFTVPSGLSSAGAHTVRVVNADGLNLPKSVNFSVADSDVSTDPNADVRTVVFDRPFITPGTTMHGTALPDGRQVFVANSGAVTLTDAAGNAVARAAVSPNQTLQVIKASASGNNITVAWLSTYSNAYCTNPGYYGCNYEKIYYDTSIYLNMQTFTVSGNALTAGTRYSSTLYANRYGDYSPAFGIEAFDISRSGAQTLAAFSATVFGTRVKGVQVWNNSTTPGPLYDLPTQTGSIYAMGTVLQNNVGFVRWGDRVYTYDVSGTTLAGGASYQYAGALASDTGDGLSFSANTGELLTSCYSNRAVCAIPTGGSALGVLSLLTGNPSAAGYVDGEYAQALFQINYVGTHPEGLLLMQSANPAATRVIKR
jgi:hypothetical protein